MPPQPSWINDLRVWKHHKLLESRRSLSPEDHVKICADHDVYMNEAIERGQKGSSVPTRNIHKQRLTLPRKLGAQTISERLRRMAHRLFRLSSTTGRETSALLWQLRDQLEDEYSAIEVDFRQQDKTIRMAYRNAQKPLQAMMRGSKEVMGEWEGSPKFVHGKKATNAGIQYHKGVRIDERTVKRYRDDLTRLKAAAIEEVEAFAVLLKENHENWFRARARVDARMETLMSLGKLLGWQLEVREHAQGKVGSR